MRVGQPRHQGPLAQVERPGAVRAALPVVRDPADHAVLDQDRGVLAQARPPLPSNSRAPVSQSRSRAGGGAAIKAGNLWVTWYRLSCRTWPLL